MIFLGAGVGLKPSDIYDMELWEFNAYIKGYKEVFYKEQMNLMKQAYYTGMFGNSNNKKPKSLEHYLDQVEKNFRKGEYKEKPVDVNLSKSIYEKIQKMKEKEMMKQ